MNEKYFVLIVEDPYEPQIVVMNKPAFPIGLTYVVEYFVDETGEEDIFATMNTRIYELCEKTGLHPSQVRWELDKELYLSFHPDNEGLS